MGIMECLRGSDLWQDAFNCNCVSAPLLKELEWFLAFCGKHTDLVATQAKKEAKWRALMPRPAADICRSMDYACFGWEDLAKVQQECSLARDSLLDSARPRIACDMPLLAHPHGPACLSKGQWEDLCSTITCRVLLILLSVFKDDFDGAMSLGVML